MKNLLSLSVLLLSCFFLSATQIDAAKKTPSQKLIERLAKIQKKGYMYGHQDDPFYGISWEYEDGRSDTKDLVGDYPAVMGFDLGGIEMDDAKNLDSVPFNSIRQEIIRHYERGGVITLSWHPRNPMLGTTAWIESDIKAYNAAVENLCQLHQCSLAKQVIDPKSTVKSILPGGSCHAKFEQWLSRVATFITSLKDSKGNQIPLIFRPWHENSGSWFWWGMNNCSDEEYLGLWNMTQDYINNAAVSSTKGQAGILSDYLIWSYSPSYSGAWTEEQYLKRYPGDDRVQLMGEDAYQWGTEEQYKMMLDYNLQTLTKIAAAHGKLLAMTECGYKNSPDPTWWQRVFKPIIEKYPIVYFLPWRNYKEEHFGATKEASTADDFKAWAKQKNFLFVNDIKKIK